MKGLCLVIVLAALAVWNIPANALTISDYDLSTFDFNVVNYDMGSSPLDGLGGDATASGTSNGIGWSISPTNFWSNRTKTDGSFWFSSLPVLTDNLHPSIDFTITFDQPVDTLLVALSNDNKTDSINFGIAPTDYFGMSLSGTQITLNNAVGGLALFENVNSFTISHTDNNCMSDGFDLAFHATPTVAPEPISSILFLSGGTLLAGRRFFKRNKRVE